VKKKRVLTGSQLLPVIFILVPAFAAMADTSSNIVSPGPIDTGTAPNRLSAFPATYPMPYPPATVDQIKAVMDRVRGYLEVMTPVRIVDLATKKQVPTDLSNLPANPGLDPTPYNLIGYEWGVTYSGMLHAAEVLGDHRYNDYVSNRMAAMAAVAAKQSQRSAEFAKDPKPPRASLRFLIAPRTMDDCGSICCSMIKTARAGILADALRPLIESSMQYITEKQMRLPDGTLARKGPLPHSLWLDDLYMSVPALAQMGALTGDHRYYDDAIKQVNQFSTRMFVPEKGLFMHGWAEEMDPHPTFYWARANGWAIAAMAELLSVLPDNYPGRDSVLATYRAEARGLAACQDKSGLWHQMLDRNDTYVETSAAALYVYSIARGVNRGWLNAYSYGPMLSLGWNAIAQQVNSKGQIRNVCIGTGMGFDPAYYAYRPTSVFASHGFGPVLLAGAEMIVFRRGLGAKAHSGNGAVQIYQAPKASPK
jgi:rhamnogalacturonyl hydrolase YesR